MADPKHDDFMSRQREHFARADTDHFEWQTSGPGFASREAALLATVLSHASTPLLEIGCGEGGNLFHVTAGRDDAGAYVGLVAFPEKLRFAAQALPRARFVCSQAEKLPFRGGSFSTVLIRDVLHHLPNPRVVLEEACRVLAPAGHFVLVEPNAHNPLIRLQMALVPAERGAARSDVGWLGRLLDGLPIGRPSFEMSAPLPLDRVILHHRFGLPSLGRRRLVEQFLGAAESVARRLMPASRWSTVIVRATRRA